jgi:phosphatidylglycerol:prolipoprotein diacylglycerol transferase
MIPVPLLIDAPPLPPAPLPLLAAWLHDLSPVILRITDSLAVRWYGLSYVAAFLLGYLQLRFLIARGALAIPAHRLLDALMWLMLGVILGGRFGYALFYQPSLLTGFSTSLPFWDMLRINSGGMASHGGILGVILACWRISKGFTEPDGSRVGRAPLLHILDRLAMVAPAGFFLGRIANFVNAELLGRVVAPPGAPAPWWAVKYPQELLERPPSELPQSLEQLDRLYELSLPLSLPGDESWLAGYTRLIERIQHGDRELAQTLEPLISSRAPSQLLQALAEGVVLGLVLWIIARTPRRPGVVGCWFLIVYGVGRVLTELVRLPDAGLDRVAGLSRGQWLSVLMAAVGLAALALITRGRSAPMPGWARPRPSPSPAPQVPPTA